MKTKTIILLLLLALPAFTRGQEAASEPRTGLFGLPTPQFLSEANRPVWLGGTGGQPPSVRTAGIFGRQQPQENAIQLPSDPKQQAAWFNSLAEEVKSLNAKLGQFDADNQQLHTELAAYRQKIQAAADYNYHLKQQLTDTIAQVQQLQNDKRNIEQQLAAARLGNGTAGQLVSGGNGVPSQLPGAPVLRANNSLLQQLPQMRIPGVSARMDGDVIRIEVPSDPLFVPNTYQINPEHAAMLQEVAAAIHRSFARQIVGIEAHWDGTPIQPATTTHHQLTATQSLAVLDALKRIGLPERQFFTMAMGSNRPRHPQGGPSNRRVEIVIYPESWEGN